MTFPACNVKRKKISDWTSLQRLSWERNVVQMWAANEVISLVATRIKELWLFSRKSCYSQTWLERSISWNKNLKQNRNWAAKSIKRLENSSQFLLSEQLCEPKYLDVALNIAGIEKYGECQGNVTVVGWELPPWRWLINLRSDQGHLELNFVLNSRLSKVELRHTFTFSL